MQITNYSFLTWVAEGFLRFKQRTFPSNEKPVNDDEIHARMAIPLTSMSLLVKLQGGVSVQTG